MRRHSVLSSAASLPLLISLAAIRAQAPAPLPPPPVFTALAPFSFDTSLPVLRAPAQPQKPFTVAGPHGVFLGQQDGTLEAWVLPVKVFSHLSIEALIDGFPEPIPVNRHAAAIEVRPDRTVITYAHAGFTVRQIMVSLPAGPAAPGLAATGPVILFEFDCLHPTDFTLRLAPNLEWMWPQRNAGPADADWVPAVAQPLEGPAARLAPGFYALHNTFPDLGAAIALPGSRPGVAASDFERPTAYPVELKLHIDPARDHGRLFPLLMAVGTDRATATDRVLGATLARLNADLPALYQAQAQHYRDLLARSAAIETPDPVLNEAFPWSIVSIDQLRTEVTPAAAPSPVSGQIFSRGETPAQASPFPVPEPPETALVAGYFSSGDSDRPGFGWFFGRDALYTLYAINSYGDFALTRSELEFLIRRQRADGKILHEYAQTAALVDWQQFPYQWAAADSTPLFLLAFADYVRVSGDTAFLAAHRDAVERAWAFETDPAHDTDRDGIYDNSQGTGWVESWPSGMPHQEIYLALLDQQASAAYAFLQTRLNDPSRAKTAERRAEAVARAINAEYYDPEKSCYAFSRDLAKDGTPILDRTRTIYPALAWWDPANGKPVLDHPNPCLRQFVASGLNTDWGARDVAADEKFYDGMSYHQGTVWPLFTGWASLAEYRASQPLAGYRLLMENALLTRAQDLGSHTELLSGDFYLPMGRSTSHQLWSSAMIITPALRGLFGLSVDALAKTITVNPNLPASWRRAAVRRLPVGDQAVDLVFRQSGGQTIVSLQDPAAHPGIRLRTDVAEARSVSAASIVFPRPPVQLDLAVSEPLPGSRTQAPRVLSEEHAPGRLVLTLEGLAGTDAQFPLVLANPGLKLKAENATLAPPASENPSGKQPGKNRPVQGTGVPASSPTLAVHFPSGQGFQTQTVTLTW